MSSPQEYESHLDERSFADLGELDSVAQDVANALLDWVMNNESIQGACAPDGHNVGSFLEFLAEYGCEIRRIPDALSAGSLLPPPTE